MKDDFVTLTSRKTHIHIKKLSHGKANVFFGTGIASISSLEEVPGNFIMDFSQETC